MPTGDDTRANVSIASLLLRSLLQIVIGVGIWGGALFGAAGTLAWVRGWIHAGSWVATIAVNVFVLLRLNPDVLDARLKRQRITEGYDKVVFAVLMPAVLAIPVVAGVDAVRYGWARLPEPALWLGLLLHVVGSAIALWALVVNPYLEKTVRIQTDRDHQVITTGPYRIVRHPLYLGVSLFFAAIPLILGSAWALAPVSVAIVVLIFRTVFEERTLLRGLPGYADYVKQTRYRILPGIW